MLQVDPPGVAKARPDVRQIDRGDERDAPTIFGRRLAERRGEIGNQTDVARRLAGRDHAVERAAQDRHYRRDILARQAERAQVDGRNSIECSPVRELTLEQVVTPQAAELDR